MREITDKDAMLYFTEFELCLDKQLKKECVCLDGNEYSCDTCSIYNHSRYRGKCSKEELKEFCRLAVNALYSKIGGMEGLK